MAWIFKHLIVALCAVLAILPVAAIYEEQLGEFDWKRENIGLIDRSFVVSSSLIVVTSKNILASLDSETGSSNWRVLLPTGTQVVEFVEVDGNIVTLTVQQQAGELPVYTVLVRCWSVLDGSLLWDAFMGSYSAAEAAQYEHGEVMYTGSKRILTVLIGNTLHFVSVPSRSFGGIPQYWSWSASSDAPIASAGQTLQLAALVAPTYIEGSSSPLGSAQVESSRLAVGCFSSTSSLSSSGHCDGKLVVVKVQLPTVSGAAVEVSLDEFPGFPSELEVSPGDVAAAISSQASLPYQANDVIFASKGSPLSADLSMVVVSLLDGSLRTLQSSAATADETATSATAAAIGSVRSFVLVSTDGELRPAATVCAGGGEECRTLSLDISSWKLRSEEDSSSSRSPCMAVQLRAHMTYPRIIQSVHCLSFAASETHLRSIAVDGAVADLTSLQVVLPPFRSTPSLPHAHAQRNLLWSAAATAPVYHVQLLSPSKSAQDGCGGRLLVVLHSGVTMLLRTHCTAGSGVPQTQVAWSRNEALASVQQALVIDSASPASASSTTGTGDVNVMPSFLQRLVLQGVKIQNYAVSAVAAVQELAETTVSAAQRLSKSGLGAHNSRSKGSVKPRDVSKLRAFGFDKVAVLLCYSERLASMLEGQQSLPAAVAAVEGVRFSEVGLQLVFVDLMRTTSSSSSSSPAPVPWSADESILGVRYLSMPQEGEQEQNPIVTSVKLVVNPAPARRAGSQVQSAGAGAGTEASVEVSSASPRTVTLIVGTASGRTLFWDIDPASVALSAKGSTTLLPWTASVSGSSSGSVAVASVAAAISTVHIKSRTVNVPAYTILHSPEEGSDVTAVTLMMSSHHLHSAKLASTDSLYVHSVDRSTGTITVYKTSTDERDQQRACQGRKTSFHPSGFSSTSSPSLHLQCLAARSAGSVSLDPAEERIVDVTYPSAADPVHVHYSILGDDSVLLKYLNPHVVLVTSVATADAGAIAGTATPAAATAEGGEAAGGAEEEGPTSTMFWTLVDTVTGRIIVRLQQESAVLPAHSVIIENHIVSTYWNSKAMRTELSSTALYEGVIDNTELTPFASSRTRANSAYLASSSGSGSSTSRSAFTSVSPIAMQKTYTLPRAVSALHHTVTAHGLSNKNLLLGLRNGQVYSVDMKQIHPRRPFSDPSPAEKTEGLVRYSPFITLVPLGALTHNYSLPGGVGHIVSAPSNLESSSLALSFGGETADLHLNRVMPSQDFDLLSSDFNYSLLVAILMALATTVRMLRNMQQRKHLSTIWG